MTSNLQPQNIIERDSKLGLLKMVFILFSSFTANLFFQEALTPGTRAWLGIRFSGKISQNLEVCIFVYVLQYEFLYILEWSLMIKFMLEGFLTCMYVDLFYDFSKKSF